MRVICENEGRVAGLTDIDTVDLVLSHTRRRSTRVNVICYYAFVGIYDYVMNDCSFAERKLVRLLVSIFRSHVLLSITHSLIECYDEKRKETKENTDTKL